MSRGRKTWLMATIFAVSQVCAPQAHSALTATFTNSTAQGFSSGTWAVVPVATNTSTGPLTSYVMTGIARDTSTTKGTYFSIRKLGTLQTISMSITQTTTGTGSYTVPLQYCTGTWTETTGACSGTVTTIMTNTNASSLTQTFTFTLAANASLRARVQYVKSGGAATVNSTISISVSRSDVRAATPVSS